MALTNLRICSLNVNGMRDHSKRAQLFTWFKAKKFGIAFLQETHCKSYSKLWGKGWGGNCFWSFGGSRSHGKRRYDFFDCFKTSYVDTGTTCPCNTSYLPRMCAACQRCRCKTSYIAHCHVAYIFLGYNDHRSRPIHNIALWYLTILRKLCLVLCVESIVKKQECMTPLILGYWPAVNGQNHAC